jgi:adenylate kinase
LIGYYYAKGKLAPVDGLAAMDEVSAQIAAVLPVSSEIHAAT